MLLVKLVYLIVDYKYYGYSCVIVKLGLPHQAAAGWVFPSASSPSWDLGRAVRGVSFGGLGFRVWGFGFKV